MAMTPDLLKTAIPRGMLAFPLTDFDADDAFDKKSHVARLEWLLSYQPAAFFLAGGAGEFFSLTPKEYAAVIAAGVETCGGKLPAIASAGYGTRTAIEYVKEAERLGADGNLLLPPYLTEGSQEGLRAHITAICKSTRLGVIVYNRANCRLAADTVARLAADCPNLIGFKDGVGDIEQLTGVRNALGDRLLFINGMPTAETSRARSAASASRFIRRRSSISFRERRSRSTAHQRRGRGGGRSPAQGFPGPLCAHPQPRPGLRGQHREGGRGDRRPQCRQGAPAAVGLYGGGGC